MKMNRTRKGTAALAILAATALSVTQPGAAANITVKGSDTMVILGQRWAEEFMKANQDVTIQVTGGGSGTGIAALINGTTALANSSRPIKDEEKAQAKKNGIEVVEFKAAMDGLAVVVNSANPVQHLTMKQIGKIYTGYINNWKEVGGPDKRILRYSRESNSGTYVYFKEHVLQNRDYAADTQTMPGTSALAEAVSKDPSAIGYGGVAYFAGIPKIRILGVAKDDGGEPISPLKSDGSVDYDVIWSQKYPISRYLYVYSAGAPQGDMKKFLDWIVGPTGQEIVAKVEYIPLPGSTSTAKN